MTTQRQALRQRIKRNLVGIDAVGGQRSTRLNNRDALKQTGKFFQASHGAKSFSTQFVTG